MTQSAEYWIQHLKLKKHPEGGYFKEVYRSNEVINIKGLPDRYTSFRNISTSIYFLLKSDEFSAFHRLKSDETWHFYLGSSLVLYIIDHSGKMRKLVLGNQPGDSNLQFTIPRGYWFAAKVESPGSYALMGCTVAPGFDFEDFELGKRSELITRYPQYKSLIDELTILE
ncbi:MAG TPA: cupin domain-containing protein [Bacteroidales bacterium]|nr:cupin domain-containing protein [Bacteroidales bacterium]HRX98039.1 cupin domain-containing protein [Bacteroidales bacterium]